MDVAVVILNWNTKDFLASFLPPLLGSLPEGCCAVVADNGSTDGSVELLENDFPEVRRILFSENHGFTGGYNRAVSQLLEEKDAPRYVLLLNSDILVKDGWLEPLLRWMESHPEYGACGPKLHALDPDGNAYRTTDRFEYAGAAGGFLDRYGYPYCRGRVLKRTEEDLGQYDRSGDVLWVSGAALMVRSSVWKALGGLDGRFFAHMEEIDLCWRMQLAGWKVRCIPESVIWHLGGGSLPKDSPWKLTRNYCNNLLMLENNLARTLRARGVSGAEGKARRRILFRFLLDGIAGIVYLLHGQSAFFKAMAAGHREYRRLRLSPGPACPEAPAGRTEAAAVPGFTDARVLLLSYACGRQVFGKLQEKGFFGQSNDNV